MTTTLFQLASSLLSWFWLSVEITLHLTLFLLVCYSCLKTRREPTSALLWIFIAWAFPLIGPALYLLFGINRMPRKAWRKQHADRTFRNECQARANESLPLVYWRALHRSRAARPADQFAAALNRTFDRILPDDPLLGGNAIELLVDGDQAYPRMLAAIQNAKHHIHMQTFIVWNDKTGKQFLDALAEKARQGVTVRFLFDRFGSTGAVFSRLFSRYRKAPNMSIVGWTQANIFKSQFQINLRNHRKIMVVDGNLAFTGGVNLADDNITQNGAPPIRDYHFELRGPIVQELQYSFLRDWYFMTDDNPDQLLQKTHFPKLSEAGPALVRTAGSGPTPDEINILTDVFFECLTAARRQALIITPYFVPQPDILQAFRAAALRGVDIRLIIPAKNNHIYTGLAGQALYEDMLAGGVRIFERPPPFIHAKAMLVDDSLAVIGSANIDVRSLRLNYETNLIVADAQFNSVLKKAILREQSLSRELDLATWRARGAMRKLMENFCYLLTPML